MDKEKNLTYSIAFVLQNIEKLDSQDKTFMNFVISFSPFSALITAAAMAAAAATVFLFPFSDQ